MPRAQQEATTTSSRRAQPRAWLRAVRWLIGAGLHSKATATTLRVAEDLARRMDYLEGTVLYDMAGTAARLEVSVPTVKRHVAVLRELGALVWLEHGSRRNLRLPGRAYAGTATVYGAVIPRCFDDAMGHRLDGAGYAARVVGVTEAGRERTVAEVRRKAEARGQGLEPPSPGGCREVGKAGVSGGLKDTPSAACSTASPSKRSTRSRRRGRSTGRPALQVARDIAIARRVRPRVGWIQHETLRRLAYSLRPLIDAGLDAESIVVELHAWFLDWRPAKPAAFITAELQRRGALGGATPAQPTAPTREFLEASVPTPDDDQGPGIGEGRVRLEDLPRETVVELRAAAMEDPGLVLAAIENLGMPTARRLYTSWLVDQALRHRFRVSDRTVVHQW